MKNRYIGRTFITPGQGRREQAVRIKLGALRSCVEGKRVVMVDDSIVRGTYFPVKHPSQKPQTASGAMRFSAFRLKKPRLSAPVRALISSTEHSAGLWPHRQPRPGRQPGAPGRRRPVETPRPAWQT